VDVFAHRRRALADRDQSVRLVVDEIEQADGGAWLIHHNAERPHLGYRNQGRRPIETINQFVSQEA